MTRREKLNLQARERYAADPRAKRSRSRAYYRANADKLNAERRAARAADPESARARERAHRARDPEAARARDRRYKARHPEQVKAKLERRRLKAYGLTAESLAVLIAQQLGLCAICESPLPERRLHQHIDHSHVTGAVRGVLCQHCNLLLGHAKENPRTLTQAIAYLEGHKQ